MGGCFSSVYWSRQYERPGESFSSAERTLDTGDIVLFAGKGVAKYLIKLDKKWTDFIICGFIVREVPGPDGLLVYQCDLDLRQKQEEEQQQQEDQEDEQSTAMIKQKLRNMLACETIELCLVRKLATPLSSNERTSVRRFLREKENNEFSGRAKLMMEKNHTNKSCCGCGRCGCGRKFERFQCSLLVASMLEEIGRVQKQDDLLYFPKGTDLEILQPPRSIALIPKVNSSQTRTSFQISQKQQET